MSVPGRNCTLAQAPSRLAPLITRPTRGTVAIASSRGRVTSRSTSAGLASAYPART